MTPAGGGPELLQAGPPPPSATGRRWRLALSALAALLALALAVVWVQRSEDRASQTLPPPAAASAPTPSPLAVSSTRRPLPTAPVVLRRSGPPITGLGSGELFVRSLDTVYRIGLETGRVTATPAAVGMSAPVGFLAGPSAVVLRPLDRVPGLLVPDDRPAVELTGALRRASRVLPGTDGRLWAGRSYDGRSSSLTLLDVDGTSTGLTVEAHGSFLPDGAGGLLVVDGGGVREMTAAGRPGRRITTGTVLATGPHHYLVASCPGGRTCTTARFDRRTGTTTRVPAERSQLFGGGGILSPDGRYVAAMTYGPDGSAVAEVVDLSSGRILAQLAEPNASADIASVAAWSADGQRLAVLDDGRLVVLDPATGERTSPDLDLPSLFGVTLRTT